jgi:tetratricopeptide (TPR) repeat protein
MFAHGDLTIRINKKSKEIKLHPNNPILYFERGYLYQQHEEYDKATLDYNKANALGYTDKVLDYRKAETYYKWGKYDLALDASNNYLKVDSKDVKINKLHAQILYKLKQYAKAVKYYTVFIDNVVDPTPEDYIEFSKISIDTYHDYDKAVKIIDDGLQKLGNHVVSLHLKKMEYYKFSNQFEKVIEEYNHFILSTQRKEFWYYKKAKYLVENNQIVQAKIALEQSKTAVSILKERIKHTQAIKDLTTNINNLEKQLNHD